MKPSKLLITAIISAGLSLGTVAFAAEHEEENVNRSKVPAAVVKAAEKDATGGKIVRWEKEGNRYEAVIEKNGKQWGFSYDASGRMLSKHDESKEKSEKNEKH
jgi:YD repeat-containing protein